MIPPSDFTEMLTYLLTYLLAFTSFSDQACGSHSAVLPANMVGRLCAAPCHRSGANYACFQHCRTMRDGAFGNSLVLEELLARQPRFIAGEDSRFLMKRMVLFWALTVTVAIVVGEEGGWFRVEKRI